MPTIFSRRRLALLAQRKQRFAIQVYFATGLYSVAPHPFLHSYRLCWLSTAPASALVANHTHLPKRSSK